MTELKNPFGLRNGRLIMIEDLTEDERGLACNCICPNCKDKFEARLGNKRTHHFSHNGEGCDEIAAYLSGIYLLIKEYIDDNSVLLPELTVYWHYSCERFTNENFYDSISLHRRDGFYNFTKVSLSKEIKFESSEIVSKQKRPTALLLTYQNSRIALCIKPPATVCKNFSIKPYENLTTLELDMSDVRFADMTKPELISVFVSKTKQWKWIFNTKAIKAIDDINNRNDTHQIKIRLEAEMRRQEYERQLEQRKKEAEMRQKEYERQAEQSKKEAEMRQNEYNRQKTQEKITSTDISQVVSKKAKENTKPCCSLPRETREKRGLLEVKDRFTQNDTQIRDSFNQRWIKCELCEEIRPDYLFSEYGGPNRVNTGRCMYCLSKKHNK